MRVLVGTRKGLFRLQERREGWRISALGFLGAQVTNALRDPRDGSLWALLHHEHWGPKLHVSRDGGGSFSELPCPAFPEGTRNETSAMEHGPHRGPASVRKLYALAPAGADGSYHLGTDPGGLFTTRDAGQTWRLNEALWRRRHDDGWFEGGGGVMLHSVLVDPRDPAHLHVAVSCGGVYESRDGGAAWEPRNRGVRADFLPDPFPETGQDPHILRAHPSDARLLWQQNHCGNYRSTDGGLTWTDVTDGLPTRIGFGLALDDRDPARAWTVPMDSDARRIAPEGALAVYRTDDAGETWRALRDGLPQEHCYDIVFRHALQARAGRVVFGTTCGRVFASAGEGERWDLAAPYLPPVNSISFED